MTNKLWAALDLARRYGQAFAASWKMREQLAGVAREEHELAFLPASLELAETPVHPAPRWAMVGMSLLALCVVTIMVVGQLEIVATAHGKLLPSARVKVIQPAVTGVVKRILVQDGQRVEAGDLLVELDPTQAAADSSKASLSSDADALAAARASALLEAEHSGRLLAITPVREVAPAEQAASQRLAEGIFGEYRNKVENARAELERRQAELQSSNYQIEKLRATAPLARQEADQYKSLVDRKYVTRTDYLDKEQNALQQEHELGAQISHAHELEQAVVVQRSTLDGISAQFRREQLDALDHANQQLAQGRDDVAKARQRESLMTLRAPVAGTVQQLAVHTLGGVVTTAQSLMEIVPDDTMEVEATLENKDIGFVHPGQQAVVKVEAFPYTRYGYLVGTVRSVSNDASVDKRLGLSFITHIQIPTNRMAINGQLVNLTPGMAVTAEITTGKRSVARYFFDPVARSAEESLRER